MNRNAPIPCYQAAHARHRHGGMTFAEVLFAVMILGIGFIMVAAIFPVAIQQSKSNTDETVAARLAGSAVEAVRQHAALLSAAGSEVRVISPLLTNPTEDDQELYKRLRSTYIFGDDPRYGRTIFYRRADATSRLVQVFVAVLQVQNSDSYVAGHLDYPPFVPEARKVLLYEGGSALDRLEFASPVDSAIEGAFVILANDPDSGARNGRILRLGEQLGPALWALQPGWDLRTDVDESVTDAANAIDAFVIGRGVDPATTTITGGNQAVTIYTALIPLP